MRLKQSVKIDGVQPQMWYAAGFIESAYATIAEVKPVITSAKDSHEGKPNSLHNIGYALDFRTHNVPEEVLQLLVDFIKSILDPMGYDVILEGLKTDNEHLHIEYDPKGTETWLTRV